MSVHNCTEARFSFKLLSSLPAQLLLCGRDYLIWLEPELPLQFLEWRRSPEGMHANDLTGGADVSVPSQSRSLLDSDARRHVRRQHAVPVLLGLLVENLPGRHGHD